MLLVYSPNIAQNIGIVLHASSTHERFLLALVTTKTRRTVCTYRTSLSYSTFGEAAYVIGDLIVTALHGKMA